MLFTVLGPLKEMRAQSAFIITTILVGIDGAKEDFNSGG
jgi:hypothetical protein